MHHHWLVVLLTEVYIVRRLSELWMGVGGERQSKSRR